MYLESRCPIPARSFFEWMKTDDGKVPYAFALKDMEIFSFVGIHNDSGFVILTCVPNEVVEPVHNRMPCMMLSYEREDKYLNPDTDVNQLIEPLQPYPSDRMKK